MKTVHAPAFYALHATSAWKEYVNLLHVPYTLWHLSYVVMGAALAPSVHPDRLIGALLAFLLAVGVGAHALDELNGRPLGTRIPAKVLIVLAAGALGAAVVLGTIAGLTITPWIFPFVGFGAFIAVAYNLGLFGNRLHSDFWFAFAWGAFPALTSYWINAFSLGAEAVLLAAGCFALSLAQRVLSTHVKTLRRRTRRVDGTLELLDGRQLPIDAPSLLSTPENALRLLSVTVVLLAASLLTFRLLHG